MAGNELKITVLPDGRIKIETDSISPALHVNADAFLANIFKLSGGAVERKHKPGGHGHSYEEGHAHVHH